MRRMELIRLMGFFLAIAGVTALLATQAETAPPKAASWYTLTSSNEVGGLWVQREGSKPCAALYSSKIGKSEAVALCFYKNTAEGEADFAISATEHGTMFQVRDDKGQAYIFPVSALLKLVDEPAPKVIRGPPAPEVVEGIGRGEFRKRLVLDVLRHHAVNRLVRDGVKGADGKVRKVDRAEAKELVASVKDETILGAAIEKGAPVEGGKLEGLLDWLLAHKEEIIRFIMLLVSLFADDGGQGTNIPAAPHGVPPPMPQCEVAWLLAC